MINSKKIIDEIVKPFFLSKGIDINVLVIFYRSELSKKFDNDKISEKFFRFQLEKLKYITLFKTKK